LKTISLFGTLDVPNNTGIGSGLKKVCINNDKAWLKLMDVSLNGALHTMHHELSQMAKQKTELSLTLSILVKLVRHLLFQYCAAKEKSGLTLTSR
jgi:NADP-dependent 3-hydroxy acid dehydrogenase YdfG